MIPTNVPILILIFVRLHVPSGIDVTFVYMYTSLLCLQTIPPNKPNQMSITLLFCQH